LTLAEGGSFWMPVQASNYAAEVDRTFYFIYYVSLFFFILIAGLMFAFIIVYRRRSENQEVGRTTHNTPLEIAWSVAPAVLLVVMFWWGFKGYMNMRTPMENSYDVRVNAQKWNWEFVYPNGVSDSELHIPVDRPILLKMYSADVLHACFIPAFRAKRDVVPGRYTDLRFVATQTGQFPMLCAEYCGTSHSDMRSTVHVYDQAGFDEYLKTADPFYMMT
jgi:cytochrome c oxidase subunit 2